MTGSELAEGGETQIIPVIGHSAFFFSLAHWGLCNQSVLEALLFPSKK